VEDVPSIKSLQVRRNNLFRVNEAKDLANNIYNRFIPTEEVIKMYVVCNQHLEDAIEEFVDTYEQPPDLYELEAVSFTDWMAPSTCHYCDHMPKYLVV